MDDNDAFISVDPQEGSAVAAVATEWNSWFETTNASIDRLTFSGKWADWERVDLRRYPDDDKRPVLVETRTCSVCGTSYFIYLDTPDYFAWRSGSLAQDVFYYLSAEQREMVMTGMHGPCYDSLWEGLSDD